MTTLSLLTKLPSPSMLYKQAQKIAEEDSEYSSFLKEGLPNLDFYLSNDGGGQEGNIVFYIEDNEVIAALLYAFDHESDLFKGMDSEEDAATQPGLQGIPECFTPAFTSGSPLLWNFEDYPLTKKYVYVTAVVWNTGDTWEVSNKVDPDDYEEITNHITYSFDKFPFIQEQSNA